jgi:EAL domain-containing protein (putative c-di-GMP-specific phosphodiesterase class I)
MILPDEFIPVAEETGLIVPIGTWVLLEACRSVAEWRTRDLALSDLHIGVNLSARQFSDPDLPRIVSDALAESALCPDALWLEITESVLMEDAPATIDTLQALKALGVHLSIDDFGTGYSSLSYLKRFPVDVLKIDRSFVDGLGTDPEDEAIVAAVIGLGRTLGLEVVAEGVETDLQVGRLRELGCSLVQGFYFARPAPGADALAMLMAGLTPRAMPAPEPAGTR